MSAHYCIAGQCTFVDAVDEAERKLDEVNEMTQRYGREADKRGLLSRKIRQLKYLINSGLVKPKNRDANVKKLAKLTTEKTMIVSDPAYVRRNARVNVNKLLTRVRSNLTEHMIQQKRLREEERHLGRVQVMAMAISEIEKLRREQHAERQEEVEMMKEVKRRRLAVEIECQKRKEQD